MYTYIYISDTPFKEHYKNHKTSFRRRSNLTASDLSKYYRKLVGNNAVFSIVTKDSAVAKCVKGNTFINNCNLCLSKKPFMIKKRI